MKPLGRRTAAARIERAAAEDKLAHAIMSFVDVDATPYQQSC